MRNVVGQRRGMANRSVSDRVGLLRVTLLLVQTVAELSFIGLTGIGLLSQGSLMIVGIDLGTTNSLAAYDS